MLVWLELRPLHDEQPGQDVNEDPFDPWRHLVSLRRTKVDVQHDDRHTNAGKMNLFVTKPEESLAVARCGAQGRGFDSREGGPLFTSSIPR